MLLLTKSESARFDLAIELIETLFLQELINYREKDDDPEFGHREDIYWKSCGESVFPKEK